MKAAAGIALSTALLVAAVQGATASPCSPGELVVPGTATCLRLGGLVRAEAATGRAAAPIVPSAPDGGRRRSTVLRTGARADLDARTPTPYGPLRAYLAVQTGGLGRH